MLFHMSLFIFRQKKLEKVMEEEGLKDEEVINIEKIFLETQHGRSYLILADHILSSKLLALVHRGVVLTQ